MMQEKDESSKDENHRLKMQQKIGHEESEVSSARHYALAVKPLAGPLMIIDCLVCEPEGHVMEMELDTILVGL
jgi:hypothetical protein